MKEIVNHRLTLASALVGQRDELLRNEITSRYTFEMVTRVNPDDRKNLDKANAKMKFAEIERLHVEQLIEDLTGLTPDALNVKQLELQVVLQRQMEVEMELIKLRLLSPVLQSVLDKNPDAPETTEARENLAKRLQDLPMMEQHNDALIALAESLAESIRYNDVSAIAMVRPTLVLP